MHDSRFDDELKKRLGGFTEEPDDALWQGIAAGISSTPTGISWLGWVSRTFLASVVVVSVFGDSSFQGAGFKFQESMAASDSKFQIQNSKSGIQDSGSGADGLEVYKRSLNTGDSQGQAGEDLTDCEDDKGNGAGGNIQRSRLSTIAPRDRGVKDGKHRLLNFEVKGGSSEAKASDMAIGNTGKVKAQLSQVAGGRTNVVRQRTELKADDSAIAVQQTVQSSGTIPADSKATVGDVDVHEGSKAAVIPSNGNIASKDVPVLAGAVGPVENMKGEVVVQLGKETDSDTQRGEATGNNNEDIGVVNYAGPARPSKGRDAVAAKLLEAIDSVPQVAKAKEAKTTEPREEKRREDKPRREPGPLSIYFTAMPTLGYQKLEANPSDNVIVQSFEKLSNFSSKRLGVRAEIGAEYTLTPRVKAFGGLLYYQRKQTISYTERISTGFKEHMSGDTLTLDPQFVLEDRSFEYELRNLGVQLGLNYILWKKKLLHVAGTGIEFHKALNKLPEAQKELGFTSHPSAYVFYNLYYRVQYPAEGRLKAIFQPTFNYSLFLNRDMNAPFYVKPYGLGLNLGVTYSF